MKCCRLVLAVTSTFLFQACGHGPATFQQGHPSPTPMNQWTWINGSNLVNQTGNYGLQGVSSASNIPPPRGLAYTWTDSSGPFWLFGGLTAPTQQSDTFLNDLWKFTAGQWTWVGGSPTPNQPGVWGVQGIAAPANIPGPREGGASWVDRSGNFWLFGGLGLDANGNSEYLNDLWRYSGGQWTWVSGSKVGGQPGVYGTQGVPSASNVPGARSTSANWIDANGNFWLFGGFGSDSTGKVDYLNDLWEYSAGQWAWISGSNIVNQSGFYGTQGAPSPANVPGARLEPLSWNDPTGTLWLFGGSPGPDGSFHLFNDLWKFNANLWTWVSGSNSLDQPGNYGIQGTAAASNVPGARVSGMTWTDHSGHLWLFGGDGKDSTSAVGQLNDLWRYDGTNWTWISGSNLIGQSGIYGTMGTAGSGNIPGARNWGAAWIDSSGNMWLFGGNGYDSTGKLGYLNDLWEYQP
ncbi:MAG TPA: kelch repeat-containing protein [Dongiaceae bacterium]|nr:kelch repeat-containing protein [Dongiaceae bacterium]